MASATDAAKLWFQKRPIYGFSHTTRTRKASDIEDAFMAVSFQAELEETHNRMVAEGSGKMEGGK